MKLEATQFLDISALYGALLTNTNGSELYVVGISLDPTNHIIVLELQDAADKDWTIGVPFDSIKDWTIQFNPHHHPHNRTSPHRRPDTALLANPSSETLAD